MKISNNLLWHFFYRRFYLFGCVTVEANGDFTFIKAPIGTFFPGGIESPATNWIEEMQRSCKIFWRRRKMIYYLLLANFSPRKFSQLLWLSKHILHLWTLQFDYIDGCLPNILLHKTYKLLIISLYTDTLCQLIFHTVKLHISNKSWSIK